MNLVVNARDAMPDGGKLLIETRNAELDESFAEESPGAHPGPCILLSVSDTGCGMSEEVKKHIFEPFFTTKEKGKGTGLGLSTVYGIVKQSEGYIRVRSEPGKGATFEIYLPCVEGVGNASGLARAARGASAGTETILLVEDEEDVRELVCKILKKNGYTVLTAREGVEALALCEKHPGPIHLVLTDVVMPKMGGPEAVAQAQTLRPDMKVLYMSGYTDHAALRRNVLKEDTPFLQKPFTSESLAGKVREVLDLERKKKPSRR
jgi:CheY-like chemotaxis protein